MENSQRILSFINKMNISYYKLAHELDISESTFSKWKSNPTSKIDISIAQKIASYFNVTVDRLLSEGNADEQSTDSETEDTFANFNVPPERMEFVRLFYQLPEERQKDMLSILEAIVEREQKNKSQSND